MASPDPARPSPTARLSRRRFLAIVGLGGASAALSVIAPAPALAASRVPTPVPIPVPAAVIPVGRRGAPGAAAATDEASLANYLAAQRALRDGVAPRDIPALSAFLEGDLSALEPVPAYRLLVGTVFLPRLLREHVSVRLRDTIEDARARRTDRAAILAWNGAELAEAAVLAFKRTGDTRFLDRFVNYFEDVLRLRDSTLGIRDDRLGVSVPAWGDGGLVRGRWIAHVTTTARICYAATEFARLTLRDERLVAYHAAARRYVAATKRALAVFDRDFRPVPGTDASYYRRPAKHRWEPINHAHQVGRLLLNLHTLTGEARYGRRASQIAGVFAASVRYDRRGNPFWRYFPYFEPELQEERAEPIWKASCTVPFVHQAARRGRIDPAIADAAARSFAHDLVRDGELNRTVDPARFDPLRSGDPFASRAGTVAGWLELRSREPEIFDRMVELLVAHRNDYFSRAWFGAPSLARGYAFCLG